MKKHSTQLLIAPASEPEAAMLAKRGWVNHKTIGLAGWLELFLMVGFATAGGFIGEIRYVFFYLAIISALGILFSIKSDAKLKKCIKSGRVLALPDRINYRLQVQATKLKFQPGWTDRLFDFYIELEALANFDCARKTGGLSKERKQELKNTIDSGTDSIIKQLKAASTQQHNDADTKIAEDLEAYRLATEARREL